MKGSFQIAKFFGIPVQIHWTFTLIFVWVFYVGFGESWNWLSMAWATVFVLALFACVVLHEFGHALTARRFGVNTRDIILSPIGGVARLDRLPDQPMHEFLVAIAGPMVNIAIVVVLSFIPLLASSESRTEFLNFFTGILYPNSNIFTIGLSPIDYFLFGLVGLNGVLAVFNLLPAFPMDGGRVLRALLSLRLGRLKATQVAAYIGQGFAVLLVGYGLWSFSLITAFIGIFIFMTAANEYRMVKLDGMLERYTVGDVLRQKYTKLYASDTISMAIAQLRQGLEHHFLVFDEWQNLLGVLSERELLEAAKQEEGPERVVGQLVSKKYEALLPTDSLKSIFPKMQWRGYHILPVYEGGKLVGVVDEQALHNFISLQQRLGKKIKA